jgi:TolA-binding protein
MSDERAPIEHLVDLFVFAPIGLLATLHQDLPKQLAQRRQAVENRVQLARFIGQMAVRQGQKELNSRLAARRSSAAATDATASEQSSTRFDTPTAPTAPTETAPAPSAAENVAPAAGAGGDAPAGAGTDEATLPIIGYESLPAINVVQRLATLRPDEVEQIRVFEQAHRGRRTILAKIEQLQAG